MKVLIVEDNERVSAVRHQGLREAGHTVDTPTTGATGCSGRQRALRVIIMDRMLPGNIDGLAIIEALRKSGNHTPILILAPWRTSMSASAASRAAVMTT